jgi:hypothetical protein
MTLSVNSSAKSSLDGLQDFLTSDLKSDATKADWPMEIVNTLGVVINGLSIFITYDEKYATKVEDLEYGTQDMPPKAIFRLFLDKHGDEIQGKLADWSLNFLVDSDSFL